jgi:hypothetical protein
VGIDAMPPRYRAAQGKSCIRLPSHFCHSFPAFDSPEPGHSYGGFRAARCGYRTEFTHAGATRRIAPRKVPRPRRGRICGCDYPRSPAMMRGHLTRHRNFHGFSTSARTPPCRSG